MKVPCSILYVILLLALSGCGNSTGEVLASLSSEAPAVLEATGQTGDISPDSSGKDSFQLSATLYPEYIYLSENVYLSGTLDSPIDRDYNIAAQDQFFIGDAASQFIEIWYAEMEYQYEMLMRSIPEENRQALITQQEAWLSYHENDVFPAIGETLGYGYVREWRLKSMDRIRSRTIELMQILYLVDKDAPAFQYQSGKLAPMAGNQY